MNQELQDKLAKYLPIRVVVRLENNEVQGQVEHSFSMDWDKQRVNIYWSGKAYSILGEHTLDGISWAEKNAKSYKHEFVVDPLAEDCPIEVDWEKWLAATDKFNKRNALFKVKPNGIYILRAWVAEKKLSELQPRYARTQEKLVEAEDQLNKLRVILNPQEETIDDDDDTQ